MSTPIQLQTVSAPLPDTVELQPVQLTADQLNTLLTAISDTGMLTMPEGKSLANLRRVSFIPTPSGVVLEITISNS